MSKAIQDSEHEFATAYQRGRAAHDHIVLEEGRFVEHLARALDRNEKTKSTASALAIEDLYLACACLESNAKAVSLFRSRYRTTILAAIGRIVPSADSDDVYEHFLQDVLLGNGTGLPKIASYSGQASLERWLEVAARRAALMWLRKNQAELRAHRAAAADPGADTDFEASFLKDRYRGHFARALTEALQRLSERDRVLLRLQIVNGVAVERIATMYNVSQPTMSRRLRAARDFLLDDIKGTLRRELGTSTDELASLARLVASRLDISVRHFLESA